MFNLIFRILYLLLWLFDAALIVHVFMSWVSPADNRFTVLLRRIVEPVLTPIRRVITAKLPARWQILDWSPLAAWLLVELVRYMLGILQGIL